MTALADPIDVPSVPPPARHPLIFSTFDGLAPGEAFEIVNDHDPLPLYLQSERVPTGQVEWVDVASGSAGALNRARRARASSPA